MANFGAQDAFEFSVATTPATAKHRRLALAVIAATIIGYVVIAANAAIPLPRINSFIPSVYAIIVVADLITAVLLYAQFSATGSRPLLLLASGYLFSALIVVGHALTFPGAFVPEGLLGAGPQSSAWLNVTWRLGLGTTIALYALTKTGVLMRNPFTSNSRAAMLRAIAIVVVLAWAFIYAVTAGHDFLPVVLENGRMLPMGRFANGVILIPNLVALGVLLASTRGRTILDLWLVVVAFALLAETIMVTFFIPARFSLGFYAIRAISVPVSKVVLIVLLWETMRLYANVMMSNRALRRERENRLSNAAAVMAAIAHEVRQPLTGINLQASAGERLLERETPDVGAAKTIFSEIKDAAFAANEVFGNLLRLFRADSQKQQPVDVNALALEATHQLRTDLDEHGVTARMQLAPDLPTVMAHAGQLREVIVNLIQHSVAVMAASAHGPRRLDITTVRLEFDTISLSVQDSGPGIEAERLTSLFDPFVAAEAKGPGAGLALCKMIVEQHGGKLSARSGERGGARFQITLPIRKTRTPPTADTLAQTTR